MVGRVAGALSMMSTITTVALLCAEVKVIVAVDGLPPTTLVGFTISAESTGGGGGISTFRIVLKV